MVSLLNMKAHNSVGYFYLIFPFTLRNGLILVIEKLFIAVNCQDEYDGCPDGPRGDVLSGCQQVRRKQSRALAMAINQPGPRLTITTAQ